MEQAASFGDEDGDDEDGEVDTTAMDDVD